MLEMVRNVSFFGKFYVRTKRMIPMDYFQKLPRIHYFKYCIAKRSLKTCFRDGRGRDRKIRYLVFIPRTVGLLILNVAAIEIQL